MNINKINNKLMELLSFSAVSYAALQQAVEQLSIKMLTIVELFRHKRYVLKLQKTKKIYLCLILSYNDLCYYYAFIDFENVSLLYIYVFISLNPLTLYNLINLSTYSTLLLILFSGIPKYIQYFTEYFFEV